MVQTGLWQQTTIQEIINLLQHDEHVRALLLKGSLAYGIAPDLWSDVDITLVVSDEAFSDFFPSLVWLAPLGEVYTYNQSSGPYSATSRVCFTDFRRIDFVLIRETDFLAHAAESETATALFCCSPQINEALKLAALTHPPARLLDDEQFERMVNDFWFKGMLATSKVMRNDLLIAAHLALEGMQDVLVLQMLLRDRVEGTSHHRTGGLGNDLIAHLHTLNMPRPYTAQGILEYIKQCSILFDSLATQWNANYQAQRQPLIEWIELASQQLRT